MSDQDTRIVELGSGVGYVGIHLALALREAQRKAQVILTDLENVCPLLERNAQAAYGELSADSGPAQAVSLEVKPLPWGAKPGATALLERHLGGPLTHIVCSDLVYFPELLAPLLRSIIQLSDPKKLCDATKERKDGPHLIMSYRMRSLEKEQPFWQALGAWFDFYPLYTRHRRRQNSANEPDVNNTEGSPREEYGEWHRFGAWKADLEDRDARHASNGAEEEGEKAEDHFYVFVGERKADSLGCMPPEDDEKLIGGWRVRTKGGSSDQLDGDTVQECAASDTFELLLLGEMASL